MKGLQLRGSRESMDDSDAQHVWGGPLTREDKSKDARANRNGYDSVRMRVDR